MARLELYERSRRVVFDGILEARGVEHVRQDPICRYWLDVDHDDALLEDLFRSAFVVLSWTDPDATLPAEAEPLGFALVR